MAPSDPRVGSFASGTSFCTYKARGARSSPTGQAVLLLAGVTGTTGAGGAFTKKLFTQA